MVFLRLTVKVLPREQPRPAWQPNSDTDDVSANAPIGKTIAFLVPVRDPENVSLGALGGLIQEKWKKLRPNAEPLVIKKIFDEKYPYENLDVDLSVADVFVQHGRASADGDDQRAIAIVEQKPLAHALFTREDSVMQDWASAATASRSFSFQPPAPTISTIQEDEPSLGHTSPHINNEHIEEESIHKGSDNSGLKSPSYDVPMQSVEREQTGDDNEIPKSPDNELPKSPTWKNNFNDYDHEIVESSPQIPREASEELGAPELPRAPHMSHLEQIDEERSVKASSRGRSGSSASSRNLERQQSIVKDSQTTSLSQELPGFPREKSPQNENHELPGQQADLDLERQQIIVKDSQTAFTLQERPGSPREKSPQPESHELPDQQTEKEPMNAPEVFERDQNGDIDMTDPDDLLEPALESQHSTTRLSRSANTDKPLSFKDKILRDTATKRKRQSPDQLPPPKEPRLELSTELSTPLSPKKQHLQPSDPEMHDRSPSLTPSRPRVRPLSFSSPQKGDNPFAARPVYVPEGKLGFGITENPRRNRNLPVIELAPAPTAPRTPVPAVEINISSSQLANMTPSRSEKNLTDSGTKLRSALRKDGLSDRHRVRRSISFVEDEPNGASLTTKSAPKASSKLAQSPENRDSSEKETRRSVPPEPKPVQSYSEDTPPSSISSKGKRRSVPSEPKPAQLHSEGTSSSVNSDGKRRSASITSKMVWPSYVSEKTIEKYKKEIGLTINSAKNKDKHAETNYADELSEKQVTPGKKSNVPKSSTKSGTPSAVATPDANNGSIKKNTDSEQTSGEKSKKSTEKRKSHALSDFALADKYNTSSGGDHESQFLPPMSTVPQSPMVEDDTLPPTEKKTREEISTLGVDKTRFTPDKVTPTKDSPTKKKTATRTISQMNMEEFPGDSHHHEGSVQRVRTPVEPADLDSQSSMAMKQLHSELELAHDESPTNHGSSPAPKIQQTAEEAPESSSESESDSESDSDSDSDSGSSGSDDDSDEDSESRSELESLIEPKKEPESEETQPAPSEPSVVVKPEPKSGPGRDSDSGSHVSLSLDSSSDSDSDDDDSDDDLFKHLKTEKTPATPNKLQDDVFSQHTFGSSNSWTPANTNKRHTLASVRADMRREQEASKAAAAAAKARLAANGTRKIRKDIFEFPSSSDSDSSDADDSDSDDRGDILPTGKEKIMSKSKVKVPFRSGFGSH